MELYRSSRCRPLALREPSGFNGPTRIRPDVNSDKETLPVARVMITCPETGKPIYTHLNFDWETFESTRIGERTIECEACGKVHSWRRCDADLDEDGAGG